MKETFPAKNLTSIACLLALLAMVSFMNCGYRENLSGMHFFLAMHDSQSIEGQEEDYTTLNDKKTGDTYARGADSIESWGGPGSGIRVPPQGSVPRNYVPYLYAPGDFDGAARELKNPLPRTRTVLERGQKQYNIYCALCHGNTGKGDGSIVPRFGPVNSLVNDTVKGWEDGRIFHMITVGRARMKPYAAQMSAPDRWAVIHYIRLLQGKK